MSCRIFAINFNSCMVRLKAVLKTGKKALNSGLFMCKFKKKYVQKLSMPICKI